MDDDSRQLAEELSIMLAYAAACRDLIPVEGRESIVLKAVRLTKEGACIIDACMAHPFAGESSDSGSVVVHSGLTSQKVRMTLGPFTGIQNRIQDCRKQVNDLRKEFDTAILVDVRREGMYSRSLHIIASNLF